MNIIQELNLVVYPCSVWVAVNCTDDFLKEKFNTDFNPLDDKLAAGVYTLSGDILIRFRSKSVLTTQYIAHEATHAALYIFDYMGCEVDYKNQEPFAFLVDCIANFCDKINNK